MYRKWIRNVTPSEQLCTFMQIPVSFMYKCMHVHNSQKNTASIKTHGSESRGQVK